MPYKDPNCPAAIEARKRAQHKYYEANKGRKRETARERYWNSPEKERKRNEEWRGKLKREERCVNCARPRDREGKTLCSVCAPKFSISVAAYHERVKLAAFDAYGGRQCKCCGEDSIILLNIHHLNDDGAKHRRELRNGKGESGGGGIKIYLWLKRNNYPPGFGILCFNCNHAIHVLGYCPHERERLECRRSSS